MIFRLVSHIIRINIRDEFLSKMNIFLELLAIIISLCIYYFTSKTFSNSIDTSLLEYKVNYFDFILFGELLLALPLFFLEGTYRKVKESLMSGVYDTFKYLGISPIRAVFFLVLSALPKELVRISSTLTIAYLFFDFNISLSLMLYSFGITLLSLPLFFSFGLVFSSILLKTGRGQALIGYFLTFMSIGAGGFFPLSVLPEYLIKVLNYFPYTILLETLRKLIVTPQISTLEPLIPSMIWFAVIPVIVLGFKKITKDQTSESLILK